MEQQIDDAIAIIEESRRSHASWIEWYRQRPEEEGKHAETCGDRKWHEEAIAGYDRVLEVLRHFERKEESMITPTVGRVVWYYEKALGSGPLAAIIAGVHNSYWVNLMVLDVNGLSQSRTSVRLVQPDDEVQPGPDADGYATWMPYQLKKGTGSESGEKEAGTQTI